MGDKSSKRQFLVKWAKVSGYFSGFDPGDGTTSEATTVFDGGAKVPDIITDFPKHANVTLTRPFDRARDWPQIRRHRKLVGSLRATLSVTPTDANLTPDADPDVYPDAVLLGVVPPAVDAQSNEAAEVRYVFGVPEIV